MPTKRVKPEVVIIDDREAKMVYKCGHLVAMKQHMDRLCPKCRAPAIKARKLRRQQNQEAKKIVPRLPDGSKFDVTFNSVATMWDGSLTVPGVGEFSSSASGVFVLLKVLDRMYRSALEQR